jgi:hypothetical protein
MTDKQAEQKTSGKSGQSIGFLRAAEKMQISTFEIPLTFLEDLGFSPDKIQAAKYMNRRFVTGFYDRVRGIGAKFSFGGSPASSTPESAQARAAEPKQPVKAEGTAKAPATAKTTGDVSKAEATVQPRPQTKKQTTKAAKPAEAQARPKPKPGSQPKKSTSPPTGASSE